MSQRLVRLLCVECREGSQATDAERKLLEMDAEGALELFHPRGCNKCNYTGYRGRTGIYEMIEVDDELRSMIYQDASEQDMLAHARMRYPSIQADGRRRILSGDTSLAEVMRVTSVA